MSKKSSNPGKKAILESQGDPWAVPYVRTPRTASWSLNKEDPLGLPTQGGHASKVTVSASGKFDGAVIIIEGARRKDRGLPDWVELARLSASETRATFGRLPDRIRPRLEFATDKTGVRVSLEGLRD